MGNSSYCRFENTLSDLRDCFNNMEEKCSYRENRNRKYLIKLCHQIAESYVDDETKIPVDLDHDEED